MPDATPPDSSTGSRMLIDEALTWLVLLHSGHASEEERRQCQAWRTSSPAHRLAYQGGGSLMA